MTISVGDTLPESTFKIVTSDGPANRTTAEIFDGKKVVLFGVPGAFTATCSNQHVPGYVENFDALRSKGVDTIAVVSVNDPFVMDAWSDATRAKEKILFLSDFDASFTTAAGLDVDLSVAGLGVRCQRFSMIVENGKVTALNLEPAPGQAIETGAANILNQL